MKNSFLLMMIIAFQLSFAQDLRGKWINIALSGNATYDDIILNEKIGDNYYGHSRDEDNAEGFCHYKFRASYNPESKSFSGDEYELIDKTENHVGCVFKLNFVKEQSKDYLEGFIRLKETDGTLSAPIYVKYFREKPPISEAEMALMESYRKSRKSKSVAVIKLASPEVKIKVFDYGKLDHDTITVFYNNTMIAHKIAIDKEVDELTFELDKDAKEHKLYFIANNIGDVAPNTTSIEIFIGDKKYQYKLFTNEKENALIQFKPIWTNDTKPKPSPKKIPLETKGPAVMEEQI